MRDIDILHKSRQKCNSDSWNLIRSKDEVIQLSTLGVRTELQLSTGLGC